MNFKHVLLSIIFGGAFGFIFPLVFPWWVFMMIGFGVGIGANFLCNLGNLFGSMLVSIVIMMIIGTPVELLWLVSLVPFLFAMVGTVIGACIGPFVIPSIIRDNNLTEINEQYESVTCWDHVVTGFTRTLAALWN